MISLQNRSLNTDDDDVSTRHCTHSSMNQCTEYEMRGLGISPPSAENGCLFEDRYVMQMQLRSRMNKKTGRLDEVKGN